MVSAGYSLLVQRPGPVDGVDVGEESEQPGRKRCQVLIKESLGEEQVWGWQESRDLFRAG